MQAVSIDIVLDQHACILRAAGGLVAQVDLLPATEMLLLHDPQAGSALAILLFDSEDDYRKGDQTLNAMSADETPGSRTSVAKYHVAIRASGTTA